ncbi:MAG: hypothetical protein LQ338_006683 [Usnochroma carphineum]|nr:MAG: hypothetical protein LQ338_006683 [Usnochroma carphineum]
MAKIKKKGTSGQAKNFITRTQAIRKLQISLPDFRRLCIYKGIYPREPRNKKKASKTSTPSTTFYYTKDIQYLLHEPILSKFRDHKALAKKIARSLGRGEVGDAARLEKTAKPRITLDHIIKERYPTFIDALRDLDDALSLLFLFASLPSTSTVPPKTIALCQRLCLEFEHYLITTHSLRKSFISIKGIYYQATIQGQDILWLVPHKFVQRVTGDVDFRIMGTFVELYTTLLGFVNYRLYTSIGLVYPPRFSAKSDEQGGELSAITLEGTGVPNADGAAQLTNGTTNHDAVEGQGAINLDVQRHADELAQVPEPTQEPEVADQAIDDEAATDAIDEFEVQGEGADVLDQPRISDTEASLLFAPYSFFLSRETPRQPLELLLRAFGCNRIGWDEVLGDGAFTNDEFDPSITHQVVDRPPVQQTDETTDLDHDLADSTSRPVRGSRMPGRTYIQPQWVWDCINQGKLLRPDQYAPGATLPPHLSPWVKPTKTAYNPSLPLADQEDEGEAEQAGWDEEEQRELDQLAASEDSEGQVDAEDDVKSGEDHGMDVASAGSDDPAEVDEFGGFASDDAEAVAAADADADEAEGARSQHQKELEAEAAGLAFTEAPADGKANNGGPAGNNNKIRKAEEARKNAAKVRKEEEEELERRKMMMSKKKRKLYEKMAYSNRQKDDEAAKLRSKRRKLESMKG